MFAYYPPFGSLLPLGDAPFLILFWRDIMDLLVNILVGGLFYTVLWDLSVFHKMKNSKTEDEAQYQPIIGRLLYFTSRGHLSLPLLNNRILPTGSVESFKVKDRTICMSRLGVRTRLTYFMDENNHAWFKKERVNDKGNFVGQAKFEPATMTFKQQSNLLI